MCTLEECSLPASCIRVGKDRQVEGTASGSKGLQEDHRRKEFQTLAKVNEVNNRQLGVYTANSDVCPHQPVWEEAVIARAP